MGGIGRNQGVTDSSESEILQQTAKTALRLFQVEIMAETALQSCSSHDRLPWVEFPGMKIEDKGLSLDDIDAPQAPACQAIGV